MEKTPQPPRRQDLLLLCSLRKNAREKLTTISRETHIPVSTLHDKLSGMLGGIVRRHTTLLDYGKLGYQCRAHLLINAPSDRKERLREWLARHPNVNSAFKINNGFTFMLDVVFESLDRLDDFTDSMERDFGVTSTQTHYIIDEIKREAFLTDPFLHLATDAQ